MAWTTLLGKFVSVQLAAQAMTVVSGILLVRTLSSQEYAYFTIANSMQSTINVLADTGMGVGLSAIGGKVWQDPYRFGQLISSTMRLRRYFALAAAVLVTPLFVWFLRRSGASYFYLAAIIGVVFATLSYQLSTAVLVAVPRLRGQISQIQILDLVAAGLRLALLTAAYFLFLNAVSAMVASGLTFVAQFGLLNRWVGGGIVRAAPDNEEFRSQLLRFVKSQAPNSIFFCFQSQISIWMIGFFGSSQGVAEVGALGRLGIIFSVIASIMTSIVVPRFARSEGRSLLRRRYFQVLGLFSIFGVSLFVLALCFPGALLWVLGAKYGHLRPVVSVMVLGAVLTSLSGIMLSLNSARGWVQYYWINIPCIIATQAFLLTLLNVSRTYDVVLFGAASTLPGIAVSAVITWAHLFRDRDHFESEA